MSLISHKDEDDEQTLVGRGGVKEKGVDTPRKVIQPVFERAHGVLSNYRNGKEAGDMPSSSRVM